MVDEFKKYSCKYKVDWPVDEYGRLGGLYSSVDLPIHGYVEMEREGILVAQDTRREVYEIQDVLKKSIKRMVPFDKVSKITEVDEFENNSDK